MLNADEIAFTREVERQSFNTDDITSITDPVGTLTPCNY